ncbi:MAG: hypothetical protein WBD31_28475 [Rubripirellula sp.]
MRFLRLLFIASIVSLASHSCVMAEGPTLARLFWQDGSDATVRYGDLRKSDSGWTIDPNPVEGFPSLDAAEQSLVQMQSDDGLILVGVHDHADGTIGSGWVAIESGAVKESHGDHSHWRFQESPSVLGSVLDTEQGNPAHVYLYGNSFVLANDKLNGFTITTAARVRSAKTYAAATSFYEGGNGHITLAVAPGRVAYATWIDREGDDSGRVDVVGLGDNDGKRYSFHCPTGGLHGATMNSGKVFFAPSDGVCWVSVDRELAAAPESVQVHHLSLGKDAEENPLRTGAFVSLDSFVLFSAGKGDNAKLCWIDASSESAEMQSLSIEIADGESLSTPLPVRTRGGRRMAVMFRESIDEPENDALVIVDLDPDKDGDYTDAVIAKTVPVGRNQIVGHSGHHEATVLPHGRELAITNPSDGTISIISLSDFSIVATIKVEGTPTRLIAVGG